MRVVQMTLDEELVQEIDQITRELKTSRSAFARLALREAIETYKIRKLEEQHREGYRRHPVTDDEFSLWDEEQVWGE